MLEKEVVQAWRLLDDLATPNGFLASTLDEDNYKRIWARDSMVCGLAALITKRESHLEAFKHSLLTLAKYQSPNGMIPSNVDPHSGEVSYGSLVGRIDANTWFIAGACLYYKKTGDDKTWKTIKKQLLKTREYLVNLEFNNKGWIYTPLSGNWADEYPVHGYTLYDNALRILAEELLAGLGHGKGFDIREKTFANFWPHKDSNAEVYHQAAYLDALAKGVDNFAAFLLPGYYDLRFDAAGNALALLLFDGTDHVQRGLRRRLDELKKELGAALIPAFWPIITKESYDWPLLKTNYSYSFKNHPGDFHNGGVWPVWMGLFAMGLAKHGQKEMLKEVTDAFESQLLKHPDWQFQEYYNPVSKSLGGKSHMGYSAAGVVFTHDALRALRRDNYQSVFSREG